VAITLDVLNSTMVTDKDTGKTLMGVAIISGGGSKEPITVASGKINVEPGEAPLMAIVKEGKITVEPGDTPIRAIVEDNENHNLILAQNLVRDLGETYLTSVVSCRNCVAYVNKGHGFVNGVPGQVFVIVGYYMGEVEYVEGDMIRLDTAFPRDFVMGTPVIRANKYLNINGSGGLSIFKIKTVNGRIFALNSIKMTFTSSAPMNDSLFVSIPKLYFGVRFQIIKSGDSINPLFVIKNNREFGLFGTITYSPKTAEGKYGMTFEYDFKKNNGAIVRLDMGQQLEIWVRDDLRELGEIEAVALGNMEGW